MSTKVRELVAEVIRENTPSLLALQTLQRVVPLSRELVWAIATNTAKATQPCSRLLLCVTRELRDCKMDTALFQAVREYWMRRAFSVISLTGLYYAHAEYAGFVRDRIFSEMENSQFIFSSVECWLPQVLSDARFLYRLCYVDPEGHATCVCQRLLYLRHLVYSSDVVATTVNLLPVVVALLLDERYVECCASHLETVKAIFVKYAGLGPGAWPSRDALASIVHTHEGLLEVFTTALVRAQGFEVAYQWFCDVLRDPYLRHRVTSQTAVCKLFECGPVPDGFVMDAQRAELFLTILLSHTSPSVYTQVVDSLGPAILNSNVWIDKCESLAQTVQTRPQFHTLAQACIPHLRTDVLDRLAHLVFNAPQSDPFVSSMPAVDLLCELHHHNPFASRYVTTEMAASCGDWDAVVECSNHNPAMLVRVIHRLEAKGYTLPDDVLCTLTEQAVRQSWTCAASCCVKYLSLIRRLSHYRAVVETVGVLRSQLEELPKILYRHLNHQRFVYFVRVWTAVVVLLPSRHHRYNLLTVLTILANYGVQKWNPSTTVLCADVGETLARSLGWHEVRILQSRVVEGGPTYLLELMIQLLYASKMGRKRLLHVLSSIRGHRSDRALGQVIAYYKVRIVLETPMLRSVDALWSELGNESTSQRAWFCVLLSVRGELLEALLRRLVESDCVVMLSQYILELVRHCREEVCVWTLGRLLDKLNTDTDIDTRAHEAILISASVVLERLRGLNRYVVLPSYTVQQFIATGEINLHSQCQLLAKLLRVEIENERQAMALLHYKRELPSDVVREIKSFLVYPVV